MGREDPAARLLSFNLNKTAIFNIYILLVQNENVNNLLTLICESQRCMANN